MTPMGEHTLFRRLYWYSRTNQMMRLFAPHSADRSQDRIIEQIKDLCK